MKLLAFGSALILFPLCGYGQSYADPPFTVVNAIPASAIADGYAAGTIHANGIAIDLSFSPSTLSIKPGSSKIDAKVFGAKPAQVFRYFMQYDDLGATFGYDLMVQPVAGSLDIKCTFSPLTDPDPDGPWWPRDKSIQLVALPADLKPLVIHSGQAIALETHPVEGQPAVIHYLRLTRMDVVHAEEAGTE